MTNDTGGRSAENDRPSWAERKYAEPCDSCRARAAEPCRTASGYVTMRHASRRREATQ